MSFIKRVLSFHLLALLLLSSSYSYSATSLDRSTPSAPENRARYISGELIALLPQRIVTNVGTYSTAYVHVLDQRTPATILAAKNKTAPQGKVQLKMNSDDQLLEVILY